MKRRMINLVVSVVIFSVLMVVPVSASGGFVNTIVVEPDTGKIELNGQDIGGGLRPVIIDNHLYVPLRSVMEALGATVTWDPVFRRAVVEMPDWRQLADEVDRLRRENESLTATLTQLTPLPEVWRHIRDDYLMFPMVSQKELMWSAAKEMVSALGDKYSRFLTPDEAKHEKEIVGGKYVGIGVMLSKVQNGFVVVKVFPGSGAADAGILPGDVIVEVSGVKTASLSFEELAQLLRGPEHTTVHIVVDRNGKRLEFDVERRRITIPTVSYRLLTASSGTVAYISITMFSSETPFQMDNAMRDIYFRLGGDPVAYIVDLRGNPGGSVWAVLKVMGYFLGGRKVGILIDRSGEYPLYAPLNEWGAPDGVPLYLLVSDTSASASEMFAAAVKSYGRGILIGQQTYGKGVAQTLFDLSDGSLLILTTFEFRGPKGEVIRDKGVMPDVLVPADKALEKALQLIDEGILWQHQLKGHAQR